MKVVAFTKWQQSSYCMFSRFHFMLSYNTWRSTCSCTYKLPNYLYNGWKFQLGLYGCYFELEKSNQQVAMSVGMQIFDGAICCIDAKPWNNRVCQHTVLPYLFIRNQYSYRMCILMTRKCACSIVQVSYANLCRLPYLLSFPCLHM